MGTELFALERFIKNGRRRRLTIKQLAEETLSTKQNAQGILMGSGKKNLPGLVKKGWVDRFEDKRPLEFGLSDEGLKILKGIRNVKEIVEVVIR